jgi:hypothetical protein
MKAKGNDHRLLVQSKWRKTDKKKKTSLATTGFTRCSASLSIRLLVSSYIEFHTFDMGGGGYPHQFEIFWKFVSGFENLITLSVILRNLQAELISMLMCVKLIREVTYIST